MLAGRASGRRADETRILRSSEEPAKRQADSLALSAGLARDTVDVVALAGPAHDQERAVAQVLVVSVPTLFLSWPDDEAPGDAEREDGHDRIRSEERRVGKEGRYRGSAEQVHED